MKMIIFTLLITISSFCYGQIFPGHQSKDVDSALQEKWFKFDQRSNNSYLLEYRWSWDDAFKAADTVNFHFHIPARITVTWFYGNKKIELATISGVFSSTPCEPPDNADDQSRWTSEAIRLYMKNKKQ